VGSIPFSTFVSTTITSHPDDIASPTEARNNFGIFWEVWGIVHHEFYHQEPLDQQQMVYGAIRGMLASLGDDYTIFQEPEDAERSHESMQGRFEGIGIYMGMENGEVLVSRPIKGSPAMKAGLQSGDVIVGIDGEEVALIIADMAEEEAVSEVANRIRGPKGSTVTLTIRRAAEGEPVEAAEIFDVDIVRDEVPLLSVYSQMLAGNIAYIQITEFKATTNDELDEALHELLPQHPTGMILDLRNNPGGYLDTAQQVLGHFYDGVALYEEMNDSAPEPFYTSEVPADVQVVDMPLVVLINENSASASEIVAGGLRDERPGTILLGETSFGKGSVQNIHRLSDGSSVRITIAHWFTPDMDEIQEIGITPEYIVPASQEAEYTVPCIEEQQPPEDMETCSDSQLWWGIKVLQGDTPPLPPE
jgi:carboxyl-terminal processing protease